MNGQCAIVSYSEIPRDELGFGEVSDDMHPQPHLLIPLLGCSSPPLSDPLQVLDRDVAPHPTVSLSFLLLRMLFPPTPPRQFLLTLRPHFWLAPETSSLGPFLPPMPPPLSSAASTELLCPLQLPTCPSTEGAEGQAFYSPPSLS